jgi:hypothetical protein
MSSYGVTADGFVRPTLQEILDDIEADERTAFGTDINTQADSAFAQFNGIFADQLDQLWALALAVYSAQNPDQNAGASQDAIAAITGATRLPATKSTTTLSVNLDAGTQLLVGRVVTDAVGNRYATTAIAENTNAYDDNVSVAAESEEYGPVFTAAKGIVNIETPVSGWSEAAAIKSANSEPYALVNGQTLTVKVDGGAVQTATFNTGDFVAIGAALAAEIAVVINADITGQLATDAGGKVRIESSNGDGATSSIEVTGGTANAAIGFSTTEVAGMNALDTVAGRLLETDAAFRIRRETLLRAQGEATVEALLADMLVVTGVLAAVVYENVDDFDDLEGREPHSIEVIILGADPDTDLDERVGLALFATKGAGIETHREVGAQGRTETVTDSQGIDHTINFNRTLDVDIYAIIDINVVAGDYEGDAAVKAALVAQGSGYSIGEDVVAEANKAAAFDVNGVYDITAYTIGTAPAPVGVINIPIDIREIARFDTSRITVNSTPVVPS